MESCVGSFIRPPYRILPPEFNTLQIHVAKTSKTGKATVTVFRGIYKYVGFIRRSHDRLFDLRIFRVRSGVAHFSGKARTAKKRLIRAVPFDDRQRLATKQSEAFVSDRAAQQENIITNADLMWDFKCSAASVQ